jgi:hydrogenase maturation protein HypF
LAADVARLKIEIQGAVQGVGFRPFVYRLATELALHGWVINDTRGVFIELQGPHDALERFLTRLPGEKPPLAIINSVQSAWLEPADYERFEIRHSEAQGAKTVLVLPDVATCGACLAEVLDPADRRQGYPFTNCTNCGPRFSIIQSLPYDRPNTTMRRFALCDRCRAEYENPLDRRFHAQPNACPVCGPRLALWSPDGETLAVDDDALQRAVTALLAGQIVAVKGLGGFHLMVDAGNSQAIARLRERKPRPHKALALMVGDLSQARDLCRLPPGAEAFLSSPQAPIVLLRRRPDARINVAQNVAPGNPYLGLMLPYTPLHHLLMRALGRPIVATSGNLSDEPICTDQREALERLGHIADLFLIHDRPIARHVDDSVAWIVRGEARLLRRARGYAPLPLTLQRELPTILAVGAHLKNTVALSVGRSVFISQHIGDLETPQALEAFERVIADFLALYEARPVAIAHDLHPDYLSTRWAEREWESGELGTIAPGAKWSGVGELVGVQHHHAHLAACLAENGVEGQALGVTWDGTGYGTDGTVWGGEFLLGDAAGFERVGRMRSFRLAGGEAAVREPRRVALGLLWELYGPAALERDDLAPVRAFDPAQRRLLGQMLERGLNSPLTTSAGRLFDGVAALLDLRQETTFEGQAAMELEFVADPGVTDFYPLPVTRGERREARGERREADSPIMLDWGLLVEAVLEEWGRGVAPGTIAARFHNALAGAIVDLARAIGQEQVALTGGCFQNRLLTQRAAQGLEKAGFRVLLHQHAPPNDGGISLGQIAVAAARLAN